MPFKPADPFPKDLGHTIRAADWNDLIYEVQRLDTDKVNNKSAASMLGPLTVENALNVKGNLSLGLVTDPAAKLHIVDTPKDPSTGNLILGPTNGSNLRLGYHADYSWVQSHGGKPLSINPIGNYVSIGSNPIDIASGHLGLLNTVTNRAEIANDTVTYKTLMILGNRSGDGKTRSVGIWDTLTVNGTLKVTGNTEANTIVASGNITGANLSVARANDTRGALFLAMAGDYNHAVYNDFSNIDGEGSWDGAKWNVFGGLNIRVGGGRNRTSALYIAGNGRVGIGATDPPRRFQVHSDDWNNGGAEIHASGATAGFSFTNRDAGRTMDEAKRGQRWVLYSVDNVARLWTSEMGDRLTVNTNGDVTAAGWFISHRVASDADGPALLNSLPNNTCIYGGIWATGVYFYWKDHRGIKHRAILQGSPFG